MQQDSRGLVAGGIAQDKTQKGRGEGKPNGEETSVAEKGHFIIAYGSCGGGRGKKSGAGGSGRRKTR